MFKLNVMRELLLLGFILLGFCVSCTEDNHEYQDDDSILPDSILIIHLPFNGDAVDQSGNSPDGVVYGALFEEDKNGNLNSAINFDGINDCVYIFGLEGLMNNFHSFSISFWTKLGMEFTDWVTVFGSINNDVAGMAFGIDFHRNGEALELGRISVVCRDTEGVYFNFAASAPDVFDNEWRHFVFNFIDISDDEAEIYVDGQKREFTFIRKGSPQSFGYFNNVFTIGAGNNRGVIDRFYKGCIDDFRIYEGALSEQQINFLFNSQPE